MKKATLLALLLAPLAATAAHAMPAAAFLRTAAGADNAEVGAGNLAAQRAASPAVRGYGRRLASDMARISRRSRLSPTASASGCRQDRRPTLAPRRGASSGCAAGPSTAP